MSYLREGKGLVASDMREAVEGSLRRLQTEVIDLYQLHWPQRTVNKMGKMNYQESMFTSKSQEEEHIVEILKAFDTLRQE